MRLGFLECASAITVVAGLYAIYAAHRLIVTKEVSAAAKAKALKEDAAMQAQLKLEDEKRIAAKNEAWVRCLKAGDRPVLGGRTTVVCIKSSAVAWEYRIP